VNDPAYLPDDRDPVLRVADGGLDVATIEAEYAADCWHAERLGVDALRHRSTVRFNKISQPWLRDATKQWCRWRLATGLAFGSICAFALAMVRLSQFLAAAEPDATDGSVITRGLLERYLSWLRSTGLAANSRALALISLRGFLEHNRRHNWLPEIPADASIYQDDLPQRDKPLPRFVSEFVMAQLEDEDHLALLEPTVRHLIVVLAETGLRANDACMLPYNPLVDDSGGWPCLRYHARKVNADQLVPLSGRAAVAIRDQQAHVRAEWPTGIPWLFPDPRRRPEGPQPFSYDMLNRRLKSWQNKIDLRDQNGNPVRVTAHQFRHTVGTRLINAGVPQHIVQRVLGHASPGMTDVYAQLHDTTIRQVFDRYQQLRVNIAGEVLAFDPNSPTAAAEWIKHNLSRVQASLPNGYCGRPPQQDCPHPNACLTCPDFQTTVEFLDVHRHQADRNRKLIARAEANGQFRLVANHQQVQENLDRIITGLEALDPAAPPPATDHG
jgi:integrase